ncbi:MAG: S8 family serine peptidase [Bacteroidia bacterium]|nr:S8 family serine peptidase [Bacteroidia bacterium]
MAQDIPQPRRIVLRLGAAHTPSFTANGGVLLPPGIAAVLGEAGANAQPLLPATSLRKGTDELSRFVCIDVPLQTDVEQLLAALQDRPEVEYAERDKWYQVHGVPNDSAWASQWGAQRVGIPAAWDVTSGDPAIIIGVIDTGVDDAHPDLHGQLWINAAEDLNGDGLFQPWPSTELREGIAGDLDGVDNDGNGFADDVIGYDFVDQRAVSNAAGGDYRDPDPIPYDDMGHGTNVTGIIAAKANNGIGIAGIAPGCRIMTLRAFDARGFGAESDVSRALAYAVANDARVINMSFGDVVYSRVLRDVIRYAYARGVVMVASAGNAQSTALHYPSAYDETISVSASTEGDVLAGFSNYGSTIDLAAPGSDIRTTDREGRYTGFYGTSASAPFVAAAAALLLSRDDKLSPEEVRGILIASAEDLGASGWDERFGAGLLRVDRAMRLEHPSVVRITSPRTDAATNASSIVVLGTAASPVMSGYKMQYGMGVNPLRWTDITGVIPRQLVDDTLCVWNISSLPDTTYTLRLAALSDKGNSLDDRIVVHIDRTPPEILGALLVPALDGNAYGVSVGFTTDEPTLGKVWYRQRGSSAPWTWASAEGATRNNLFVGTSHAIFLGPDLFVPGRAYEFYLSAENAVGLETLLKDENGNNLEVNVPAPVSGFGFDRVLPALPLARLFGTAADLNGNGWPEALLNDLSDDGRLKAWEYNGLSFERVQGVELRNEIPRGIGDVTADGRPDLLTSIVRNGFLNTGAAGAFPSTRIWGDSSGGRFWPITIEDVTGDGGNEVLAIVDDSTVGVFRWNGNVLERFSIIVNPTGAPPPGNAFSAPRVAVGDFNGNGKRDLLFGDADGDFFIAEYDGSGSFPVIWGSSNDFVNASDFVVAGDFTGDGRDEFAVGFRTDVDDVVPYWFMGIFHLDNQNKAEALWSGQFHGVAESSQYGSFTRIQNSLSAGDLDGDAALEIVLSVYPELYIIDYDPASKEFSPVFHLPLVNTNAAIITDIDGDGVNELGIALVDSVVWYRKNIPYTGPEPPRGITVEYVSASSARIEWTIGAAAPEYRVYKGADAGSMQLFGTFPGSVSLLDPALVEGQPVLYAVTAFNPAATPQESPRVYARMLRPHQTPVVDSVVYAQQGQLLVYVSQDMGSQLPSPSLFRLDGAREPVSVALLEPRVLLLSFGTLNDGSYGLYVTGLRDGEGIPFDDALLGPIEVRTPVINACYIERVEFLPPRSFRVTFSAPVESASASAAENYVFEPGGVAETAEPDPENPRVVLLAVRGDMPIGALGKEYVLSVRNVRCSSGSVIGDGPGSTAGVVLNRQTLDEVFVYPNPLRPEDAQQFVTFANLTPQAVIRVYTVSGMFIREVVEDDGNGGVEWDLRDSNGQLVPGGVYLFRAEGKDLSGRAVDPKLGKFAIIR